MSNNPTNNLPLTTTIAIIRAAEGVALRAVAAGETSPTDLHAHQLSFALEAEGVSWRHWDRAWSQFKVELRAAR